MVQKWRRKIFFLQATEIWDVLLSEWIINSSDAEFLFSDRKATDSFTEKWRILFRIIKKLQCDIAKQDIKKSDKSFISLPWSQVYKKKDQSMYPTPKPKLMGGILGGSQLVPIELPQSICPLTHRRLTLMAKNLTCLHCILTPTLQNTFGINWSTDGEPNILLDTLPNGLLS